MACALDDANSLFDHMQRLGFRDVSSALHAYSAERVPEGNAITRLNFASVCRRSRVWGLLLVVSQLLDKLFRGRKTLMEQLVDPAVAYTTIERRLYI